MSEVCLFSGHLERLSYLLVGYDFVRSLKRGAVCFEGVIAKDGFDRFCVA